MTALAIHVRRVGARLASEGMLLEADARLPSVTSIVARAPVRGSWWSHPAGSEIYHALNALMDEPDVVRVRLVDAKVTLVHRRLFPSLLAIAGSGEPWQTRGLAAAPRRLLALVGRHGEVRCDRLPVASRLPAKGIGEAARELERRLLVHGGGVHTESGAHAKVVAGWGRWAKEARVAGAVPAVDSAKSAFEEIVARWDRETGARGRLPWEEKRRDARVGGRRPRDAP